MKTQNNRLGKRDMETSLKENSIILMERVSKQFGEKNALKDVTFKISSGEIFGLLGPSGAGKTTLIKILTGQMSCSGGTASVFGVETNKFTEEIYGKIGTVLDNSGLYERLTCYDNLLLFCRLYHQNKKEIFKALEEVELLEDRKTTVSKLSKGMRQRLILARAVLHKPKLLFLDEPTSGLDPATTIKIHELLLRLKQNNVTIFLTTHDMEEASKLCDTIGLLYDGKIIEYGNPQEICRKYNKKNTISILFKDGTQIVLPNHKENAEKIAEYFRTDNIMAIHSSEPNLEAVFLTLTGRKLV